MGSIEFLRRSSALFLGANIRHPKCDSMNDFNNINACCEMFTILTSSLNFAAGIIFVWTKTNYFLEIYFTIVFNFGSDPINYCMIHSIIFRFSIWILSFFSISFSIQFNSELFTSSQIIRKIHPYYPSSQIHPLLIIGA